MIALSFVGSVIAFFALRSLEPRRARSNVSQGFTWIQAGTFRVDFRFLVDPLSSTMILFVTGVGTLIHLYSIGYMHGDERFSRFFAYLNLFAASMLVLVLGSSFLLTFMGWEGVGLCSYLLVSFWFERNSAAVAGKKAFITNRVGDFGFMLAMFLIFQKLGTLDYSVLGSRARPEAIAVLPQSTVTAIALLLFVGAMGKSAQLPLHIWLPDAMEGPTPVSALIHAATMVTAGVFLLVRAHVFFDFSNHAGTVVAWVGAITALYAASVALVQNDIKRVLAYSTISQLGYMFLAVGVGAYSAAIFHMITHAFFKALLFLGAGSVIHGMHDEQDMRRMGGLRKFMPITAGTFIFGWLAISGIIPFAGFWSKDEILAKAWFSHNYALWAIGAAAALMTAFYMTRQVWLVFYGPERWRDDAELLGARATGAARRGRRRSHRRTDARRQTTPHESPSTMYVPLVVLAVLSFVGGFIDLPFTNAQAQRARSLARSARVAPRAVVRRRARAVDDRARHRRDRHRAGASVSTATACAATAPTRPSNGSAVSRAVLENALVHRLSALARFVSGPVTAFARFLSDGVDKAGIDGAVNGIATVARRGQRRAAPAADRAWCATTRSASRSAPSLLLLYVATRVTF